MADRTQLTPERLAELRRIAEAATPGPLRMHPCEDARYAAFVDAPHLGPDAPELAVFLIERDARFFAEFDRDTMLAMLDEIERLRRVVESEGFRLTAEILRGLEWSGWDERFRAHMCPVCGGYKSNNKHFPDCDLNKALSLLDGEKGGQFRDRSH